MPERRHAVLSEDGLYRYQLERRWDDGPGALALWIMLNPSTADANVDDATIRRCRGFTAAWGLGGFVVLNLFALRATKPAHLLDHPDPIGPENPATIRSWLASTEVSIAVAAWGAWKVPSLPDQDTQLRQWAGEVSRALHCLGTTRDGDPRHPLYLPKTTELAPWSPAGAVP